MSRPDAPAIQWTRAGAMYAAFLGWAIAIRSAPAATIFAVAVGICLVGLIEGCRTTIREDS